jgi:phage shock protein E
MFDNTLLTSLSDNITIEQLQQLQDTLEDVIIIDVRSREEFMEGSIEESVNIPFHDAEQFAEAISDMDMDLDCCYVLYGNKTGLSAQAQQVMKDEDYTNVYNAYQGFGMYEDVI